MTSKNIFKKLENRLIKLEDNLWLFVDWNDKRQVYILQSCFNADFMEISYQYIEQWFKNEPV